MTMTRPIPMPVLPAEIPVFPLAGVLLLPRGELPLNIFEPRYLAMVDEALRGDRMIGMIQPKSGPGDTPENTAPLYTVGCAGRIIAFRETDDGRYEITLRGLARFTIEQEQTQTNTPYRRVQAGWDLFAGDTDPAPGFNLDRIRLKDLLRHYFAMEGMECDWSTMDNVGDDSLITCLSMVCPLDAGEKQALLEARGSKARAEMFMALLEMATRDTARARPDQACCH